MSINWDYAATWATAVNNGFRALQTNLAPTSFLFGSLIFRGKHGSTNFKDFVNKKKGNIEHLGPPEIAYYPSLYPIVMLISGNSCGIIQE